MSSDVLRGRKASCQHCGDDLLLAAGEWVSTASGTFVCIPGKFGQDAVPHAPMPEGLRGAPE